MIDFHCHLDLYRDPASVIRQCDERGLYVLSVTTTPSAWTRTNALAQGHQRIRTALGLHPELAGERITELSLFDELLPKVRYVGEIGLDGSPELKSHWNRQVEVFEHILSSCAAAGGRVMSIHSRRAVPAILDRLEQASGAGAPILHWYSGTKRDLERAVEAGCWFSVGPPMVLSQKGRQLIEAMPESRILTETDGPFTNIRGENALPWDVSFVVSHLATVWKRSAQDAEEQLRENLRALLRTGPELDIGSST